MSVPFVMWLAGVLIVGCGPPAAEPKAANQVAAAQGLDNNIHADFDAEDQRRATETIQWLGKEWSHPTVLNEVFRDAGYLSLYTSAEWPNVRVVRSFNYDDSIIRTHTECRTGEGSEWIEHGPNMVFSPDENNLFCTLMDRGEEYTPAALKDFVTIPMPAKQVSSLKIDAEFLLTKGTGHDYAALTEVQRKMLCMTIQALVKKRTPSEFLRYLNGVYDGSEPAAMRQKISEVAAAGVVLMDAQDKR